MPVPLYLSGVVKIFVFPRSKSGIFDLNLHKIERFSKVSRYGMILLLLCLKKHRLSKLFLLGSGTPESRSCPLTDIQFSYRRQAVIFTV